MNKLNRETKIQYLKVSALSVDPSYQRELDERRAGIIAKGLDFRRIGVLVVSRRPDGTYVVIDGQHRHAALVINGYTDREVRCEVHVGLSVQDEARLFRELQKDRKPVGALDDYKAALKAEDPAALDIHGIITRLKLKIAPFAARRNVAAILAVKSVYHRQKNLERTLRILRDWDDSYSTFHGEMLKAMSLFLAHYDDREDSPPVDDQHLLVQLRGQNPEAVLSAIKRRQDGRLVKLPEAGCSVFLEIYNRRLGPKKRLPPYIRGNRGVSRP